MISFLDNVIFTLSWPWPLVIVSIVVLAIALGAYAAKGLTAGGALCAFVMATTIFWTARSAGFLLFMLFFFSCTAIGKVSKKIRSDWKGKEIMEKKGSRRDQIQVIANGLMATLASLLWFFTSKNAALVMFGAAVAEATSDTFAGEIGKLSKRPPVSILTMRQVPRGLSGGVTVLGLSGAAVSAFVIALCWYVSFSGVGITEAVLVWLLGFAGSVIDSYLGAGVQALYYDPENDEYSEKEERDGRHLELSRGIRWIDNDVVNLMSNTFSAVFALGMCTLIHTLV